MIIKRSKSLGFTLLEVLIAMTLLSIMVTLLFSSLKVGAESWDRGETKIAEVNEKTVVYQFFKRYLPGIRPLWDDFSTDKRFFSFQGDSDSLQFVSVFPSSAGRKGLQHFELNFDDTEGLLNINLKPFYPLKDGAEWEPEEVVLLENIKDFNLSYFDKKNNAGWVEIWQKKETLPVLVKIQITLENESYWPEMIFDLKLSSENSITDPMMEP